jgi:catechol 2,3-dioxygenase-like lactoylglutathione lyase family enzyme
MSASPRFTGSHFFVRDMPATLAFYRRLGFVFREGAENEIIATAELPGGIRIAFGTYALTRAYDAGFREPGAAPREALQFSLESRPAVDELYAELTAAGYDGHLDPFDAFWGSRYAEVEDPDGNLVGLQSPADDAHRRPPPASAFG